MGTMREIIVGEGMIGDGHPVFVIAEIGINHNGSLDIAKKIIEGAKAAGCDAVKFQKRTPEVCVPKDQWNIATRRIIGKFDVSFFSCLSHVRLRWCYKNLHLSKRV